MNNKKHLKGDTLKVCLASRLQDFLFIHSWVSIDYCCVPLCHHSFVSLFCCYGKWFSKDQYWVEYTRVSDWFSTVVNFKASINGHGLFNCWLLTVSPTKKSADRWCWIPTISTHLLVVFINSIECKWCGWISFLSLHLSFKLAQCN